MQPSTRRALQQRLQSHKIVSLRCKPIMAVREIKVFGQAVLSRRAEPITNIDDAVTELARDMVLTMHQAPGLGLSAPQVDVSRRLITVDLSVGKDNRELIVLINPRIIAKEGESVAEEGCLSVPGVFEKISRPLRVEVKGVDLEGRERIFEARELLARVLCHEIDHLDGKLFIERLSPLKRQLLKRRLRKELRLTCER
ncbi:MAG: peptide deformylase [Candidatus Aminicenantes bacterium RBG_13_63_10]|nr:MAG: peptide deformylase [Candidatus Aminicenantes bacterium RBG_13_63_10]